MGQEFCNKKILAFVGDDAEVFYKANLDMSLREAVCSGFLGVGSQRRGGIEAEARPPSASPDNPTSRSLKNA